MSSTPALDVPNAETEIYPLLTVARLDRLRPFAQLTSVEKGEILCRRNEVAVSLYLSLSICLEIEE